MTAQQIDQLIQAYAGGPRLLEAALAGIPKDELHFKPDPEHWSIHENVVHLADTDLVAAARIRYILAQPGATLVAFDQNHWARAMDYAAQSTDTSVALLRVVRQSTADLLRRAPAEAWEQTGAHTELGPQTIAWIVEHFADHMQGHLSTIAKRRRQYAEARGESLKAKS